MRKLLVVLAVLLAVGLFAGAQYSTGSNWSDENPVTLSGNVTICVFQWLDASFTPLNVQVVNYGEQTLTVGKLHLQTNGDVGVKIKMTSQAPDFPIPNDPSKVLLGGVTHIGVEEPDTIKFNITGAPLNKDFDLEITVDIPWNLPEGDYIFGYEITIYPEKFF